MSKEQTKIGATGMSLAQLSGLDDWKSLDPLEQKTLSAYIERGVETGTYDFISAAVQFGRVSVFDSPVITARFLSHAKTQRILGHHFGSEGIAQFLEGLANSIRRADADSDKQQALAFFWAGVVQAPELEFGKK